jgi:hypothetical protein
MIWIRNPALKTKKIILPIRIRQQDADPTGTIDNWAPGRLRIRIGAETMLDEAYYTLMEMTCCLM